MKISTRSFLLNKTAQAVFSDFNAAEHKIKFAIFYKFFHFNKTG